MNKDVIYIEPEDDITDIITKIENAKEKIVALVPPKKATVLRSIVNIKLITKAGAAAEKKIVLVTTDPSIIKLAAAVKLPVTKNLQTAPAVPKAEESLKEDETTVEKVDEEAKTAFAEEAKPLDVEALKKEDDIDSTDTDENEVDKSEKDSKKDSEKEQKLDKKSRKLNKEKGSSNNPVIRWVLEHKKVVIFSGVGAVALILVLVWMFAIAPAVTVEVGVRTTSSNFSENVTFTDKIADENASEGRFYLEEKKLETKTEVTFEATGKKNVGEKASGTLTVYTYIPDITGGGASSVSAGDVFYYNGHGYVVEEGKAFSYDGEDTTVCDNEGVPASEFKRYGCLMSGKIAVTAEGSGSDYNVTTGSSDEGWSNVNTVYVSGASIAGGTDKTITVVQQSDVDAAKAKLEGSNESVNKQKLLATIKDEDFVIESSFKQTVGDAVASPAVGEEVKDNAKAKLTVTTTDTIYVIDSTKVEEFIREKAKLNENYKIYELNDPFIENFTNTDNGYVAKLKTSYVSGPKITESDVVEIIRGKGIGTARQDLEKAFDGISKIVIDGNFPWVSSVPGDNNKITVNISVEEK